MVSVATTSRDPRLFARKATGDIYWVVSSEDLGALDALSDDEAWNEVTRFERVSVFRQANPPDMVAAMDGMVSKLEAITL